MCYKIFHWFTGLFFALALSLSGFTPALAAPPANDNFANAEAITSLPFSITVDNTEATVEPDEPVGCGSLFRSVWYSFTPSETMALRVDMPFRLGGTVSVFLASGLAISDLTFLVCASSGSSTNFQVEAGNTYYLRVDSFGQAGVLQFNLEQIFPPANDNFANAESIRSLPFSATADNTNATLEAGEPLVCGGSLFRSVWYSFTPTETMAVRVDMAGGAASVFLASGPAFSGLTAVSCASSGSSTNFQVEAGKAYYLRVDSFGQPGVLQVNLQQIFPPTNDNFTNAEVIGSLPFSATVDNTNATTELGEPQNCSFVTRTVWYAFTPTETMSVRVDTQTNNGFMNIYRATGPELSDLQHLECMGPGSYSTFLAEAGQTYYFQASLYTESGTMEVNLRQAFPPANDIFANAEVIPALPFSTTPDLTDVGIEPGEPQDCGLKNHTVWYSFTPTETMSIRAEAQSVNGFMTIYRATGSGISDLQSLPCISFGSPIIFQAEAGQTYYLQVGFAFGATADIQVNLQQVFPPANDTFAGAETVTAIPFSTTIDITDAWNEPNEPQYCSGMNQTVWYAFSPTETMTIRADTQGSSIGANLNVYKPYGSEIFEQNFLGCTANGGSVSFLAEAGQTYYLQAGNAFGENGTIQINLQQAFPPANDIFSNAEVITSLPFSATSDITDATNEAGEPQNCYSMDRTVWYSFTPTETMTVRVDAHGSGFNNGIVSIYHAAGSGISGLQFLNCAGPDGSPAFLAEAGQTYYLQAGFRLGVVGSIQVTLEQTFPPPNDNFANAEVITSLPFSAIVDNTDATTESGEPTACGSSSRSVWYSFTPAENMTVRVDTLGSSVSGIVNVYLASGPGISDLTFLTCAVSHLGGSPTNIQIEAGKTYYLQVDSEFGAGAIQVNLEQLTPPAHDNFANAETIASLPFGATVDNTNATNEPGEPQGCSSQLRTVWYSFTPSEAMTMHVDMLGSTGSGSVDIYLSSGSTISDLSFVTCATSNSSNYFNVEAGKTYYIRVAGDVVQPGILQVNLEEIVPPANDNFANAEAMSSLPFSATVDTTLATLEADEPIPSCGVGATDWTIWYAFTPATSGSISATIPTFVFTPVFAAYTGNSLTSLTEKGCSFNGNMLTFHVDAGSTYYIQVGNLYPWEPGGSMQFHLDIAPQPVSGFSFSPLDPSVFDNIQFCDTSFDPGEVGIQALTWDFGDGATSTENCAFHQYTADGNYTVQQTITTFDGRTASSFQVVQVRTHDVSVKRVAAPRSAKAGQTRTITLSIRNTRYPETVTIELYRSIAGGGFELIAITTQLVPVRSGSRTTQFRFNYTFTPQDAQIGKVTFKAIVIIENARDAFPADNGAISTPPTRVKR